MSAVLPEVDLSTQQPPRSQRAQTLLAIAVNAGLALFVLGNAWQIFSSPAPTMTDNLLKLAMIYSGVIIAASAWVLSLRGSSGIKASLICVTLGFVSYKVRQSVVEFDTCARVLLPGRLEDGRWVHDGLGLSFAQLPGWKPIVVRPYITASDHDRAARQGRTRLWRNERAIFFQFERQADSPRPGSTASTIRVEAVQFRFTSMDQVVTTLLEFKSVCAAQRGVKIVHGPQWSQLHGIDFAEFSFVNEQRNSITRSLLSRSGCYLLCFVLEAVRKEDVKDLQQFVDSIHITHRPKTFSESLY